MIIKNGPFFSKNVNFSLCGTNHATTFALTFIKKKITKVNEGTRPAVLKRFGETSNPEDELI